MENKLTKDEFFDAVMLGVKAAILEMCEGEDVIRTEQFMEQIRLGTYSAIWQIATNATDAPCADFYDSIENGVKKSMDNISFRVTNNLDDKT